MIHELFLHPDPFELIKSGKKDIEMRLYDERRKNIKIGDYLRFTNRETSETILVEVINLYRFRDFVELYRFFDKKRLGYKENEIANPKDMEIYYSKDKIEQFGSLAIEIKLLENNL